MNQQPQYEQISMYEIAPDVMPTPEVWECMETCVHPYGKYLQLNVPGFKHGRCRYGLFTDGTSGNDWYETIINGYSHFYCKYYKRKEREHEPD